MRRGATLALLEGSGAGVSLTIETPDVRGVVVFGRRTRGLRRSKTGVSLMTEAVTEVGVGADKTRFRKEFLTCGCGVRAELSEPATEEEEVCLDKGILC